MLKGFVRVTTAGAQCDYNDYNCFAASNSDCPKIAGFRNPYCNSNFVFLQIANRIIDYDCNMQLSYQTVGDQE